MKRHSPERDRRGRSDADCRRADGRTDAPSPPRRPQRGAICRVGFERHASTRCRRPIRTALPSDLDDVFAADARRGDARLEWTKPEQDLAAALAFYQAGQSTSRAGARGRFARGGDSLRGGAPRADFPERGDTWRAIEWLERAAEAPAPAPSTGTGCCTSWPSAGTARRSRRARWRSVSNSRPRPATIEDVATRVDRLVKVQARG